jgi:hypothetical protein
MFPSNLDMKKYLSNVIIGCLGVCAGFALSHFREDHGAQIPEKVRACFDHSYPGCTIRYVTTPHIVSEGKIFMVYRISFRNLNGVPISEIFSQMEGRGEESPTSNGTKRRLTRRWSQQPPRIEFQL